MGFVLLCGGSMYIGSTVATLTWYCTVGLPMGLYFIVASWENRRKDRKYGKPLRVDQDSIRVLVEVYPDLWLAGNSNF